MPQPPRCLEEVAARIRVGPRLPHGHAIVGMQRIEPAETTVLLPVLAGVVRPRRLRGGEAPVRVGRPRDVGDDRDERAEALLGPLSLGDVEPGRVEEPHGAELVPDRMHREVDDALGAVGKPVAQGVAEGFPAGSLERRRSDSLLHLLRAAPPRRFPERPVEHLFAGVAAVVEREDVDLDQAPPGSMIPAKIPDWLKTDSNLAVRGEERFFRALALW